MDQSPLVSIIIPVYNAEAYLSHCVSSVLRQTYQNIEVLLIDDGSTDASPFICDAFAQQDTRVTAVHMENGGVSCARSAGISRAKGDYLLFVDNDDSLPTIALEAYVSRMIRENVDIIQGKIKALDNTDQQTVPQEINEDSFCTVPIEEYVKEGNYRTDVWGKLYNASFAKKYRFPEGHYSEDYFFNALYFTDERVQTVGLINIVTYLRYDNPRSASHMFGVNDYLDNINVLNELYRTVMDRTQNLKIRDQYLRVLYTQFCKNKYNIILRKGYTKEARQVIRRVRRMNLYDLWNSRLKLKEKSALHIFSGCNASYRAWLLHFDPTMRHYEQAVRSGVYQ